MADNWDEQVQGLENLASQFGAIERKALRAVANAIKPILQAKTPVRGLAEGAMGPLPEGALRNAVRGHVDMGDGTKPPAAVVDFGPLSYVAHMVDVGHRAPHARTLARAGRSITGKPTPAHPFVRSVQDSSASLAQSTFEDAMTEGITNALEGK